MAATTRGRGVVGPVVRRGFSDTIAVTLILIARSQLARVDCGVVVRSADDGTGVLETATFGVVDAAFGEGDASVGEAGEEVGLGGDGGVGAVEGL